MNKDEASQSLFKEGVSSYLDAMLAIKRFREEVLRQCKNTVIKSLENLSNAIGIKLDKNRLEDFIEPDGPSDSDYGITLGWIAVRIPLPETDHWITLDFGLLFERNKEGTISCRVVGYVETWYKESYWKLYEKTSSKNNFKARESENKIILFENIKEDSIENFEKVLETIIEEWIKFWKSEGGVKKFFGLK